MEVGFYIKDSNIRGLHHFIQWDKVIMMESNLNHLQIWLTGKHTAIEVYSSLASFLREHPAPDYMVRTGVSFLVNERKIIQILFENQKSGRITLEENKIAYVSRDMKSPFAAYYRKHFYHGRKGTSGMDSDEH